MSAPSGDITASAAAALLGIRRETLHRWVNEGRLGYPLMRAEVEQRKDVLRRRPRGPKANPRSRRYTIGRHRFTERTAPCTK